MNRRKPGTVPLERALSKLGLASRSQAREWIAAGRIRVNGTPRGNPAFPVIPEGALIELDGRPLRTHRKVSFLLYKPAGVVTTRSDEQGRATVFSLLKDCDACLHAVGRLDLATSGLLILTDDTRLSSWLTDPANRVIRAYVVTVRGEVTEDELRALEPQAEKITLRKSSRKESHLIIELTEGKNREIRKMFEAVGHEVTRLKRTAFGGLTLGSLKPGEYRELSQDELKAAFPTRALC